MPNIILGLSGAIGHDPAVALYIDGELVAACEEERFVRRKHARDEAPYLCRPRLFADGRCARARCHSGRDSFRANKLIHQSALALCLSALVCARPRDRQCAQWQSSLSLLSP